MSTSSVQLEKNQAVGSRSRTRVHVGKLRLNICSGLLGEMNLGLCELNVSENTLRQCFMKMCFSVAEEFFSFLKTSSK